MIDKNARQEQHVNAETNNAGLQRVATTLDRLMREVPMGAGHLQLCLEARRILGSQTKPVSTDQHTVGDVELLESFGADLPEAEYQAEQSSQPVPAGARMDPPPEKERDMLAEAIRDAAVGCGLIREDVSLTGPDLLMLCDNLRELAQQSDQATKGDSSRDTLLAAAKRLRLGVEGPRLADELEAMASRQREGFDFAAHLERQRKWSQETFGPGPRTAGVLDHIRKELLEVEAAPHDSEEWIDIAILALDGAWRSGLSPRGIIDALVSKQGKNEGRAWPDWRTADPEKAIEHVRTGEERPSPGSELVGGHADTPHPLETAVNEVLADMEQWLPAAAGAHVDRVIQQLRGGIRRHTGREQGTDQPIQG